MPILRMAFVFVCRPESNALSRIIRKIQPSLSAVPAKTNLRDKRLIIVPGDYDLLKSAEDFGHFTAGNVTFERTEFEEGSAGHLTLHIIYIWKSKNLRFDFEHRSVNIYNFDPPQRPAKYNRAAQIKITEQIMSTFRKL
jgi:hypothetical protein